MKIIIITLVSTFLSILGLMMHCLIRKNRLLREIETQAADRLQYIRTLIEIVYIYKHDTQLMLKHLQAEMTIKRLLNSHVVADKCDERYPGGIKCTKKDKLLYMLYQEGFSTKELCVLFELNNLNSVYVKCCRMNKKMKTETPLE